MSSTARLSHTEVRATVRPDFGFITRLTFMPPMCATSRAIRWPLCVELKGWSLDRVAHMANRRTLDNLVRVLAAFGSRKDKSDGAGIGVVARVLCTAVVVGHRIDDRTRMASMAELSTDSRGMDPVFDRCGHGDCRIGLYSVGSTSARQELERKNRHQERPAVGSRRTLSLHPSPYLYGRSPCHTGIGSGLRKSFGFFSLLPRLRRVVAQDSDRRALADARVR